MGFLGLPFYTKYTRRGLITRSGQLLECPSWSQVLDYFWKFCALELGSSTSASGLILWALWKFTRQVVNNTPQTAGLKSVTGRVHATWHAQTLLTHLLHSFGQTLLIFASHLSAVPLGRRHTRAHGKCSFETIILTFFPFYPDKEGRALSSCLRSHLEHAPPGSSGRSSSRTGSGLVPVTSHWNVHSETNFI